MGEWTGLKAIKDQWLGEWMSVKAIKRSVGGWMEGWMNGWIDGYKQFLRLLTQSTNTLKD